MPLYRRLPKYVGRPMGPGHHKTNYGLIKLSVLNKCDANSEVTYESCLAAGHMTKVLPAPFVMALDPAALALALAPPHAAALLANRPCPAFSHLLHLGAVFFGSLWILNDESCPQLKISKGCSTLRGKQLIKVIGCNDDAGEPVKLSVSVRIQTSKPPSLVISSQPHPPPLILKFLARMSVGAA